MKFHAQNKWFHSSELVRAAATIHKVATTEHDRWITARQLVGEPISGTKYLQLYIDQRTGDFIIRDGEGHMLTPEQVHAIFPELADNVPAAKQKLNIKPLTKTIGYGRQDVLYTETFKVNGRLTQISIRSDSYDFQCHAKLLTADEKLQWSVVLTRHHSEMETPNGLIYTQEGRMRQDARLYPQFEKDRNFLFNTFVEMISDD